MNPFKPQANKSLCFTQMIQNYHSEEFYTKIENQHFFLILKFYGHSTLQTNERGNVGKNTTLRRVRE
jgi:hypothetical protein